MQGGYLAYFRTFYIIIFLVALDICLLPDVSDLGLMSKH